MKKRIVCILLAAVLLLGMADIGIVRVHAASEFRPSQACVDMLKAFEGFSATPYWDYSQYTVGYGTKCPDDKVEQYMAEGITEEEAEALLNTYLEAFSSSINTFLDKFALDATQNQFDALILFSFNCGTGWLYDTCQLRSAVVSGATGNDLIHAMALWCNAGGSVLTGLIRRRLSEANLYLNGVYSTSVPENYCYVQYNAGSGKSNPRVQGYDAELTAVPIPTPTYEGHVFEGWYTSATGGSSVTLLDSSVRNRTLYAHWQADASAPADPEPGAEEITGTPVNKLRQVTASTLNVYEKPDTGANVVDALKKDEKVWIVAEYTDAAGKLWGRVSSSGWIDLSQTQDAGNESGDAIDPVTVTVTADYVNLREGPGTDYRIVGGAETGETFVITATASGSGYRWGKFDGGWIALTYTNYDSVSSGSTGTSEKVYGTVTTYDGLRIRSGAGTGYSILGFLSYGTRVEITEQKTVSGSVWGKIAQGWICLDYVKLDNTAAAPTEPTEPAPTEPAPTEPAPTDPAPTEPAPTEPPSAPVKGTVNTDELRIRSGPSTGYSILGYLYTGDRVEITEQKTTGAMVWGKIAQGWISMDYVTLDSGASSETPGASGGSSAAGEVGTVVNTDSLRIRSGPSTDYSILGYLSGGTTVTVTERASDGYMQWGKITQGWISLDYVAFGSSGTPAATESGTVRVDEFLRIRTGPSTSYAIAGYLYDGDRVEITEKRSGGGMVWGKIAQGWISLDYVELDGASGSTGSGASGESKTVNTDCLHIRSGAGTQYEIVGYLYSGAKVTVTETTTSGGRPWGKTDKGWICMDYVK